jgi:hypothetical protein
VSNFRLARSNFVDNRIECRAPPYETDICHSNWFGEASSDTHPRSDQLSTAVFWFGHDGFGQPCSQGCDGGCGGPTIPADRVTPGYSGTCWENDMIISIPAAVPAEEVGITRHAVASRRQRGALVAAASSGIGLRRSTLCLLSLSLPLSLCYI